MSEERRKHHFLSVGWDGRECSYCRVDSYATQTTYCDEVEGERETVRSKEEDKIEAIRVARKALTKEQWELLGLNRVAPYRQRDYIIV